jgi:hypothetical protein
MNPSRVRWGILFILIGLVFLANSAGWLSWWIWSDLLRLWPILLIAIGLEMIVKHSKMQWLGYLSTLLIIGAFIWVIAGERSWYDQSLAFERSLGDATIEVSADYEGQRAAEIRLEFTDGRLWFGKGQRDELLRVRSRDSERVPELRIEDHSLRPEIDVDWKRATKPWVGFFHLRSGDNDWRCYLHPDVTGVLDLELDDCEFRLDGRGVKLDTLRLEADDSDLRLQFDDNQQLIYVDLEARDTDVTVFVPDSAGIKIDGRRVTASSIERFDLAEAGDFYINDLFGQAPTNLYIRSDLEDGRLLLRRY